LHRPLDHRAGPYRDLPDGCLLRTAGDWLAVPNPINPHSKLAWLHMPVQPTFTPPWLASSLADRLAATDPHLGTP